MSKIDETIFFWLHGFSGEIAWLDQLIVFLAEYLAYILPIVFLFLVLLSKTDRYKKILQIVNVFCSAILARFVFVELIRVLYYRPRPFMTFSINNLFAENSFSFPSAHAAFFFAFAFAVLFFNKKMGVWLLFGAIIISVARVTAGVHYPTDILAGAIVGLISAILVKKFINVKK